MSSNPYADPNADADLLDDTEKEANKQKSTYSYRDSSGQDLPYEVQEALSRYVDFDQVKAKSSNLPVEFKAMASMFDFFSGFTNFNSNLSIVTAMADIIDEMTGGKLEVHVRYRDSERMIIVTHVILRLERLLLEAIKSSPDQTYTDEIVIYVESFLEQAEYMQQRAIEEYRHTASIIGKEVDEGLIATGAYTERDFITRYGMSNPPAESD